MIAAVLFVVLVLHSPNFSVGVVGFVIPQYFFRNAGKDVSPIVPTTDEAEDSEPPLNRFCATLSSAENGRENEEDTQDMNAFMLSFFCQQQASGSDGQLLAVPCNASRTQEAYRSYLKMLTEEFTVKNDSAIIFIRMTRCSDADDTPETRPLPFLAVYYRSRVPEEFITYEDILFQFTDQAEERQPRNGLGKSPMLIDIVVNDDAGAAQQATDGEVPNSPLRQEADDSILSKLWNMTLSNSSGPVVAENVLMATYLVDRLDTTKQLENSTFLVIPCMNPVVISDKEKSLPALRCRLKLPDWGRSSEAVLVVGNGPLQNITIAGKSGQVSAILGTDYTVPLKYTTANGTSLFEGDVLKIIRRWARSGRKVGKVLIQYSSTAEEWWQGTGVEDNREGTDQVVPFGSVFLFLKISKKTQAVPFRWRLDALSREASKSKQPRSGQDNSSVVIDLETTEWMNTKNAIATTRECQSSLLTIAEKHFPRLCCIGEDVTMAPYESSLVAPEDACRMSDFPCPVPTPDSPRTDHVGEYLIEQMMKGGNQTPRMWGIACSSMTVHLDGVACNISMEGSPVRPERVELHLNFTLSRSDNSLSSRMSLEVDIFHCDDITVTKVEVLREPGAYVLPVTHPITTNSESDEDCVKGFFFRPICFDQAAMIACDEDTVHFDKLPFVIVFPNDNSG
uniref:ZP domain-containing protein n=1 Tax=Branchiostoma floridae TaxID=7739 RepID=C3ZPG7_BRAFL|eukprot:XP_002589653.1 hypothetical protein BRAFLDRAFT_128963 [Branchiostoma floridae]